MLGRPAPRPGVREGDGQVVSPARGQPHRRRGLVLAQGHASTSIGVGGIGHPPADPGADVTAGGPAAQAGIPKNAIVTKLDDRNIASGDALVAALENAPGPVVLVGNEVGLGIVPDNALARAFRDHAGWLNQTIAHACDELWLCVAGHPLRIKPNDHALCHPLARRRRGGRRHKLLPMRPRRRRMAVSKVCTPMEMRLAPASMQAWAFSMSKWLMRPSMVNSQSSAIGRYW